METNYTLKRLKLFGTVFAALFAVLMLSSFKAEAQVTITISGSTEICLAEGGTLATYTANVTGGTGPFTYAWSRSVAHGNFESGQADNTTSILWLNPSCEGSAWVQVTVTDTGNNNVQYVSEQYEVNLYDPEITPTFSFAAPFTFCANEEVMTVTAPLDEEDACNATGWWKSYPPGTVEFEDEYDFTTTIIGANPDGVDIDNLEIIPGTYTITWTFTNGPCYSATATTTLTIHPLPEIAIEEEALVELCYEGTIDLIATATNVFTYQWYKVVEDDVTELIDGAISYTYTVDESGTYYVVGEDEFGCLEVTSNAIEVVISELKGVSIAAVPTQSQWHWDEDINITFTATLDGDYIGDVTYTWYLDGETVGTNTDTYVLEDFNPKDEGYEFEELDIWVTVYETIGLVSCTLLESEEITIEIIPPVHAMFSPSYVAGGTPARPSCLVNIPINTELWIEFSQEVFTVNGLGLPGIDLGDVVALEEHIDGEWILVPFTADLEGNRINILPNEELKYGAQYRIRFYEIYKEEGVEDGEPVIWTLDLTDESGVLSFDEDNFDAYEETKEVCFTTMTLQEATLPTVYPTGDNVDLCAEIKVEFVNPVKYLNGNPITDNPHHKFRLQKKVDGDWVSVPFEAVVGEPVDAIDPIGPVTSGPVEITLRTDQMDYCTEYQVIMNPNDEGMYGFIDITTGFNVLPKAIVLPEHVQGDLGWTWTTTCTYDITVTFEPLAPFNNANYNNVTVDALPVAGLVVGVPAILTDTFTIDYDAGTVTLLATPGEGYHFVMWTLNGKPVWEDEEEEILMGKTWEINVEDEAPDCDEHNVYKAWFEVNEYMVERYATPEAGGEVTVEGQTENPSTHLHGTLATWTATPEAGYYVSGWNWVDDDWFGTETGTFNYSSNPEWYLAPIAETLVASFTGEATEDDHGSTYTVTATFSEFLPKVYATAFGRNGEGAEEPEIADILFTTLFVENMSNTGTSTWYHDGFRYQHANFKYGNPRNFGADAGTFYPVTVEALNVPCEYEFVKWERAIPIIGVETVSWEWEIVSEDEVFAFIPIENYRLRAVYEWRTDVMVSVDNLITDDAMAMASFRVTDGENIWFNDATPKAFAPGTVLTIRAFPEPNYFVYGWVDGFDNIVEKADVDEYGMIDVKRGFEIIGEEADTDETEWTFVVGCEDIDLRAVVGKKRFLAEAQAMSINSSTIGGFVENSIPAEDGRGEYGHGWFDEDTDLGFVASLGGYFVSGYFEIGDEVTFVAEPKEDFGFIRWAEGTTQRSTDEEYIRIMDRNISLVAEFEDMFVAPTWTVTLLDEPAGAAYELIGGGEYEDGATVTVTAVAEIGWTFVNWTEDGEEVNDDPVYVFEMEEEDVTLVANFEQTEYDLELLTRTYMRKNTNEHPYTTGVYRIGELEGVYGGTVEDLTNDGPYVFGDIVTLKATPAPGFKLVNWMVGDII
jgi:hypothetical protein